MKKTGRFHFLKKKKLPPVLPTPAYVQYLGDTFHITDEVDIFYYQGLGNEVRYLQERLKLAFQTDIMKFTFRSKDFKEVCGYPDHPESDGR
ncbi:MAG: hypothetical protein U5N26_09570 [Candidatus Marinimicrobia bacterium]|nr:hypothetical protein [Candidatus Neomarinimicrobiota bacterium]